MKDKLVSVIMSAYNEEEKWIRKSIESILNQTYRALEFIIVLDNPNNKLLKAILEEYATSDDRIKLIYNSRNIGLVASMNVALEAASGDYVARMDADDISRLDRIEIEVEALEKYDVDVVMGSIALIDEDDEEFMVQKLGIIKNDAFNKIMRYGNISAHPTWLQKKLVYDKLGGYRELSYCEDVDYLLRAIQAGYKCIRLDEVLLNYRVRRNGISKSYSMEQKEKARYLRHIYRSNKKVADLDVSKMNLQFGSFSENEKKRYEFAMDKMEKFAEYLSKGMVFKCIVYSFRYFFTNRYFRKDYIENVKCNIVRLRS